MVRCQRSWGYCLRNKHHYLLKYRLKLYFWLKKNKKDAKYLLLLSLCYEEERGHLEKVLLRPGNHL